KAYALRAQKMNETGTHCGLRYEREPGYFYVAMFVSYALAMAEMIAACVGLYIITGYMEGPWPYLIATIGTVIVLSPLNYRYSRVVLLYWLTPGLSYQPETKKVVEKPYKISILTAHDTSGLPGIRLCRLCDLPVGFPGGALCSLYRAAPQTACAARPYVLPPGVFYQGRRVPYH